MDIWEVVGAEADSGIDGANEALVLAAAGAAGLDGAGVSIDERLVVGCTAKLSR